MDLQVLNGTNDILATYTDKGSQYLQVEFANTDAQSLIIKAVDTRKDNKIKIDSIGIYRVTERLQDYLDYFVTHHNSAGISKEDVEALIDTKELSIYNYLRTNLETMGAEISDHTTNLNNPHVVTCAQIDAAKRVHTHTPSECGAAPEIHTHDPADIGAAYTIHEHTQYVTHTKLDEVVSTLDSTAIQQDLNLHKANTENPHNVTYEQIGAAPEEHEHDQYVSEDKVDDLVKTLVSQVIIESNDSLVKHVTDTNNPHETTYEQVGAAPLVHTHIPSECGAAPEEHEHHQYVSRDEISDLIDNNTSGSSGTSVRPMSVISFTTGQVPTGITNSFITKPITPVLLPYILHRTNSNYDYYDGVCRTNRPTVEGYPLYYAFKKNLSYEDLRINTCAFSCSVAAPVLLEYEFHTTRKISGYIITPNTSNDEIGGYISAYTLYINGKLSHKSSILSFGVHQYTFDEPMNVSVFSLRATKITTNNSKYFGCKIEFIFSDVSDSQIKLKSGLKYLNGSTIEENDEGLLTTNTVTSIDTPKYLYIKNNTDPDADTLYELTIDKSPYEYNYYQEGLPVLLGKYEYSNINTSWGTITSTDDNTSINTVYKDNGNSYLCASGTSITHEFTDPQTLSNLKLVFANELLESGYIPDIISVVVHTKSLVFNEELQVEEEVESDITIFSTDSYVPYLPDSADDGIWLSPNFNPKTNVTSITISLGSSTNNIVGISNIIPYISTNFFNILTNEVTDTEAKPFLLGKLDYVSAVDGSFEGCSYSGISIGTNVIIPIDGLDKQENGLHVYRIPNPFHTNYIECSVMIYNNGSYTHTDAIESMTITSETIEIVVFSPARYCLNIKRIW